MNETGITFSWLGAYALAGLLGFLGGKAIDQILAVALKRRLRVMGSNKKKKLVSSDEEIQEQLDLIKDMADKNNFKLTHFDLKKELKRQQIANRQK
jgi:hypothetical protein